MPFQPRTLFSNFSTTTTTTNNKNNIGGFILRGSTIEASDEVIGFKQLFDDESCTYSYLLWDTSSKDAVLVDPVDVQVDRDMKEIETLGLNLVYAINTHAHADHITGTGILKQKISGLESVISKSSGAKSDVQVSDGDSIVFGKQSVVVKSTPGHTQGCVSYVAGDGSFVLTGDTLLVQGCGRTDFQGGSADLLFDSVQQHLFSCLDENTTVYPAHDYKGRTHSTIGIEKEKNPRLGGNKSKAEFIDIMENLNLSYPKMLDVAVPANMRCGLQDDDGM